MQKVALIYNPVSGTGKMAGHLDEVIKLLQEKKMLLLPLRTPLKEEMLESLLAEGLDYVLVSGGDGTIHQVVNILSAYPSSPPVGVIPAGTANDFAVNLGLPGFEETIKTLNFKKSIPVDVGRVGNRYFINVALGGLLTDAPHKVDQRLKNNLGKLAYYLRGVSELPNLRAVSVEIDCSGKSVYHGDIFLYVILNGKAAGNLGNLAPRAALNDGLFDVLIFKKSSVIDAINLFFKVLAGKHIGDPHLLYLQCDNLSIRGAEGIPTDLDGEEGPPLPWQVELLPGKLQILKTRGQS